MKRILFLVVFMVFGMFAAIAGSTCTTPDNGFNCGKCPGGSVSGDQGFCCDYASAHHKNVSGCLVTSAPINKGLIFLLIAGLGLGSFVVYKNNHLKLV